MNRLWAPWRMAYVGGGPAPAGCIFCTAVTADDPARYLVVHRASLAFLILNAYPYSPGHLMAVVNRHVPSLAHASPEELAQGRVAGAGIEDHLHLHVVPRWNGDTNFMPVLGDVRVLPESLDATCTRLRAHLGE